MHIAACGDFQKPLRTDIGRARRVERCACYAFLAVLVQPIQSSVSLFPGKLVRLGDDRPECDPDPGAIRAARLCGFRIDPLDLLLGFGKRLSPQAEDIAERTTDAIGGVRGATERNRNKPVCGPHRAAELLELVIFSVEVEGLFRGPGQAQDADIFLLALIAFFLVEEVAFTRLFFIAAAGNEVHHDTSTTQLIERRERLGRNCGINRVRPQGDDDLDVFRVREHRGAQREGIERR
ncbi:hypothetical protein D3C87_1359970 [compost metagenome]